MVTPTHRATTTLISYGLVIFISSACLLILEIVASRLLAPYVGVSLYTWTAIIGVILAGLSLGNWLGGVVADRGAGRLTAGWTLVASGIVTLMIPQLLVLIADGIQAQPVSLLQASLLFVLALFFLPALVLGIITPLLTTLALTISSRTGHVVGTLHALAALGSICGTFAAGFILVPWFGTRSIIVATGIVLAIMGLVFLLKRPKSAVLAVAAVAASLGVLFGGNGLRNPCDSESLYYCIRVVDEPSPYGVARSMVLDHMVHSINHRDDPEFMITEYTHAMDELLRLRYPAGSSADVFFAGGGAYTQPRALAHRLPNAHIEVAELDPQVTAAAVKSLYVDISTMTVHHNDARVQLGRSAPASFDAIVTDVFHDVAIPWHLTTTEFAGLVKSRLKPGGLYLVNVIDVFPDSKLVKGLIRTLQQHFNTVQVWLEQPPSEQRRLTYVITATNGDAFPPQVTARNGIPRTWYDFSEPVQSIGTPMEDIVLLTDNHAPVERLISTLFWSDLGL
ncbi:MAG: hypothetical protein DHS20C01_20880 [marine bacterium B5-7]|nr:MAG: hypothetical protein DHS20C01_20880 [marine bacterium B5-7]